MAENITGHEKNRERPYFLIALGTIGIAGCAVSILGTLIAPFFVPDYNWMADTISDLAAGDSEIIMDVALYCFAAGLFAVTLAASHAHLGRVSWSVGVFSLAILSALVVIIGARNEYGDADSEGVVIHVYLVYALGFFFALAPLSMAQAIGIGHRWAKWSLLVLAVLWSVGSPIFFFLPTSFDGLFERVLGLIACAIVTVLSIVFLIRGRDTLGAR